MIPNWSNCKRNTNICNWWLYYTGYVGQRHRWIQQHRSCVVTGENRVSSWIAGDLTIDINEHTNWGWTHFLCTIIFLAHWHFDVTMQLNIEVGALWKLEHDNKTVVQSYSKPVVLMAILIMRHDNKMVFINGLWNLKASHSDKSHVQDSLACQVSLYCCFQLLVRLGKYFHWKWK